jgi:hypothetical protein
MERLFLESVASRYKTDPRYSGEEGVDYAVRIWLNPERPVGRKVRLEVERLDSNLNPPHSILESDLCPTIEAALVFLNTFYSVPERIYSYVLDDLVNKQRNEDSTEPNSA